MQTCDAHLNDAFNASLANLRFVLFRQKDLSSRKKVSVRFIRFVLLDYFPLEEQKVRSRVIDEGNQGMK